jgi:hypothetical protein
LLASNSSPRRKLRDEPVEVATACSRIDILGDAVDILRRKLLTGSPRVIDETVKRVCTEFIQEADVGPFGRLDDVTKDGYLSRKIRHEALFVLRTDRPSTSVSANPLSRIK